MRVFILALLTTLLFASHPKAAHADLRQVTVPDLHGLTIDQANAKLKKAGFMYPVTQGDAAACDTSSNPPRGSIYCQEPWPEQQVFENKLIIVKLYTPPPPKLTGLKLVGLSLQDAKKQLAAWKHTGHVETATTSGEGLLSDERKLPPCAPDKVCDVVPWEFRDDEDITLQIGRKVKISAPD
jgi:beta-lactam-binding protein with PASTA domain